MEVLHGNAGTHYARAPDNYHWCFLMLKMGKKWEEGAERVEEMGWAWTIPLDPVDFLALDFVVVQKH